MPAAPSRARARASRYSVFGPPRPFPFRVTVTSPPDSNTAGAKKIWLGKVDCTPNTMGPPHHHGEAETAAYVVRGHIRVYYGEDYKEYVEAGPGEFIFVPANFNHIEGNPYDEPAEAILSRGPDNIVINL